MKQSHRITGKWPTILSAIIVLFFLQVTGIVHMFYFTDPVSWKLRMSNEHQEHAEEENGILLLITYDKTNA